MKKDTITQFVCFITNLAADDFVPAWEKYARGLLNKKSETTLQQLSAKTANRFRYVSRHVWPDVDFRFSFMKERHSEHFPDHNVKVVQLGGYFPLQEKKAYRETNSDTRLIAFVSHDETDIDFYRQLPCRHLDIHQAYYENCTYGYVMEFVVHESEAENLREQLKKRSGVETGIYRECLASHV